MACSQTLGGLLNTCDNSMGGIKRVLIANYAEGLFVPMTGTGDTGKVEINSGITGVSFYQYYIRKNTSSFTSTLTKDDANGTNYVETKLNLVFTKQDTLKRLQMTALASAEVVVLVQDANGIWWAMGKENPVVVSAGTGESGTAKGDGNKYTLEFTDESASFPFEFGGVIPTPANPETV